MNKTDDRRINTHVPLNAVVVPIEVENPHGQGGKIVIWRSVRDDPLAWMHYHDMIDDAEYAAGRKWQMLYERSEIGGVQAMDTSKEPVDGGGGFRDAITDAHRRAVRSLQAAMAHVRRSAGADRVRSSWRVKLLYGVLGTNTFPAGQDERTEVQLTLKALAENHVWQNG